MLRYKNKSGNSGITAYLTGENFIKIRFIDGIIYTYNNIKPGKFHVENMKRLAEEGEGLSSYISINVRENFWKKG